MVHQGGVIKKGQNLVHVVCEWLLRGPNTNLVGKYVDLFLTFCVYLLDL